MDQFCTSKIAFFFTCENSRQREIWSKKIRGQTDSACLHHDTNVSKPDVTKVIVSPKEEIGTDYGKMHYCMILVLCRYCR